MSFKVIINNILRKAGLEIQRFPGSDLRRRAKIIDDLGIDLILDVGANAGQYGRLARSLGYRGQIFSFEPVKPVFALLEAATAPDDKWKAFNYALGEENYTTEINVSKNTYSSSILEIDEKHVAAAPESVIIDKETIQVRKLDDVYPGISSGFQRPFLKLDVQGFEKKVLDGAKIVLRQVQGVQLELSLSTLYRNETTFTEMLVYMNDNGFELVSLENGLADPNSAFLLQADGIFIKAGRN
jgi:FkbM family methyltransferase